ncbi:uncharacterized protein LOC110698014 [Chenopodium quinoa]|uniref:uncharacterized protein LOC110698014 n=1 Tax=Chenopodium quinoa TaxID=63459 RepID=UPI000B7794D7|nr:uncharacterized protein LOC110698014 [Chenopodium quinoa]
METLDPIFNPNSPNKRLKSESLTLDPAIPSSIDKGKAPIIDDNDGETYDCCESPTNDGCGICFSEEGRTVRGFIDSCDHYFCFLCIIEWSKIESRCPLCRGRFSSIRRMRKDGSFIGQGSVRVPVRDQIYDPFGEPVDPYARAKCSVCNGTTDECLLLLCDLCDSASHTFCVGLGASVPEDDWFCRDCALLRDEQLDNDMSDDVVTSIDPPPCAEESLPTSASVSIFDIVRDPNRSKEFDSETNRLLKLVSQNPTKFSSKATASDQSNIASAQSVPGERDNLHPADMSSSARTLQNCRNAHRHINVLRENWGAFRTGSLSFSLVFSDSLSKASKKKNVNGTSGEKFCELQSISSASSLQSKSYDDTCDKDSYNVDRAWKLMTKAKTVQQTAKSKNTPKISQNKAHSLKIDKFVPKCVVSGRKDLMSPKFEKQKLTNKVSGRPSETSGKHRVTNFTSQAANASRSKHQKSCVPKLSMPREVQTSSKANIFHDAALLASSKKLQGGDSTVLEDGSAWPTSSCGQIAGMSDVSHPRLQRMESSACPVKKNGLMIICASSKQEPQTSAQAENCRDKTGLLSDANLGRGLSNISDERNGFASSTSSYDPIVGGSDASNVKLEGKKISACPGSVGFNSSSKGNKDDDAKGEIQSLVKLNLKLLCKDKRLDVDAFKEIARLSTHTILASCGFEHRKIVSPPPTLVCHHGDQTPQFHRSTVVPSSCRECFYVFVKDVVNSIMSKKLNSAKVAAKIVS